MPLGLVSMIRSARCSANRFMCGMHISGSAMPRITANALSRQLRVAAGAAVELILVADLAGHFQGGTNLFLADGRFVVSARTVNCVANSGRRHPQAFGPAWRPHSAARRRDG